MIFSKQDELELKTITKRLYDFTKEQSGRNTNALPELVTEGFDEEQIWQQLELQNENELIHFSISISKVLAAKKKLVIPVSAKKPKLVHTENDSLDSLERNDDMSDDKESENENIEFKSILKKKKIDKKRKKSSIVDDKFFKLQELDEYLIKEERKEKRGKYDDRNDNESDDESVDLFNDFSEEEDDNAQGKYLKYTDFFDSPPSEDDQNKHSEDDSNKDSEEEGLNNEDEETDDDEMEEDEEEQEVSAKRVKFNLTNDSDETDSLENKVRPRKEDKEEEEEDPKSTSSVENRKMRLLTKLKTLEEKPFAEKPWQLKGELNAPNRFQNCLLEDFISFDVTARPAPEITEETTMKLEDIIKQRIKDKAWDDVEKKFKPVETPLEYKKKLIMNQEKSKESLSQIYENEYLKQKQALNPEENEKEEEVPELHREIKNMMRSLMSKLDALSNYHYTPKRVRYFTLELKLKLISGM